MTIRTLRAAIFAALALAAPLAARAASYTVPDHFGSIQEAIDGAAAGDTIYVRPGIYFENVVISSKTLTLKSLAGAAETAIDGSTTAGAAAITINGNDAAVTVEGFTIQNAPGSGVLMYEGTSGGVLQAFVNDCVISRNGNSGIIVSGGGPSWMPRLTLSRSLVTNNTGWSGGGMVTSYSIGYIYDSTIANNHATYDGGGVAANWSTLLYVYNSRITRNTADRYGGGVSGYGAIGYVYLTSCLVDHNTAGVAGGGASAQGPGPSYRAAVSFWETTVADNTAPEAGAAIALGSNDAFYGENSIFWGNSSAPVTNPGSVSTLVYSDIQDGALPNTGVISADPMFVNPAKGNYLLFAGSPAINAANPAYLPDPATRDLLGAARLQGGRVDMGAYEWSEAIAPVSEATVSGTVGQNGIYTSAATVSIAAQDPSGVKEIHYTVNGVETVVAGAAASFDLSADGTYAVSWWAVDAYGNAEMAKSLPTLQVDAAAPALTASVAGTAGTAGWYKSAVTVTLSANDGAAGSGVKEIHYTVNGVETVVSGASASVALTANGTYTVTAWAVDLAGNASATQTLAAINVDAIPPTVASINPAKGATNVSTGTSVTITFSETVTAANLAGVTLKRGSSSVTVTRTLSGRTLTLRPSSSLSSATTYTVTVPAGAVVDQAGGGNVAYTSTFKTR